MNAAVAPPPEAAVPSAGTSPRAPKPLPSGRMAGLILRHSVGLPAMLAVAGVIVANVMLRERDWVHQWFWAFFNYHFVVVFLGPLAAGLGAWEGARLAGASDLLRTSGSERRALLGASGGVVAWLMLPYLAGMVWISAMVSTAGTPGTPDLVSLSTLVPALMFLGMWTLVGVGAGYRFESPLVAPLAAVGAFSIILSLYILDYDLVRVGGATGSLLGLAPRPGIQFGQTALYIAAASWGLAWPTARPRAGGAGPLARLQLAGSGALSVGLAMALFLNQGPDFRDRAIPLRCLGQPPICLADGYDGDSDRVRDAFAPLFAGLQGIGAPLPKQLRMGPRSDEDLIASISEDIALGGAPEDAAFDLITAYVRSDCDFPLGSELGRAWEGVTDWFRSLAGNPTAVEYSEAELLRTGSPEAKAAWLRGAIDRLRRCA